MLFKRHLQSFATMTGRRCNRETATNKNASIRQSCSGLMSALCVPFRVFLVQPWQCSRVNKKQIWVLLHTFSVEPHPPRGAGVVTLTAAVSPCMQELSSVPGYCQPTQNVSDKGVLNKGSGYGGSFPEPPKKVLPLWRA